MRIINTRTWLYKDIKLNSYTPAELNKIYKFYTNHDSFAVIIDGEIQ